MQTVKPSRIQTLTGQEVHELLGAFEKTNQHQ